MHHEHNDHCCGQNEQLDHEHVHAQLGHICTSVCMHEGAPHQVNRPTEQLLASLRDKKKKRKKKLGEWSLTYDADNLWPAAG